MRATVFILLALLGPSAWAACPASLDFQIRPLLGQEPVRLCDQYAGKVILVVNTASKCGFTPQYEGLEALYKELEPRGFVVLGFPSNDFGGQEPGSEAQIGEFCRSTYGVQFPMFEKTVVHGDGAHPFYRSLIDATGKSPKWNFYKYLIDRDGRIVHVFSSMTSPDSGKLRDAIEALL